MSAQGDNFCFQVISISGDHKRTTAEGNRLNHLLIPSPTTPHSTSDASALTAVSVALLELITSIPLSPKIAVRPVQRSAAAECRETCDIGGRISPFDDNSPPAALPSSGGISSNVPLPTGEHPPPRRVV
jgi:hypothetical protein